MDRVRSLGKILTRFRGMNFCTISARFPPSFVRQPSGPKYTQMVRNVPKHQFRVKWGGSGAFVAKNSNATSWHELLHSYDHFAPSFVTQPNAPQCTKIVRNAPKHEFRVRWGGSVHSLRKILKRLLGTNFCTSSARFAPSFVTHQTLAMPQNYTKCTKTSV